MTKTLIVAALLSSFAAVSFAQDAASAAEPASAPHKHMKKAQDAQGRFRRHESGNLAGQEGWQLSSPAANELAG
jgi:Spy/CpxP family protein refolding chaperone